MCLHFLFVMAGDFTLELSNYFVISVEVPQVYETQHTFQAFFPPFNKLLWEFFGFSVMLYSF